jgi:predicted SAM-dependent methyltransferase
MDRKEKLLAGLNIKDSIGMEIGPLSTPVVSKRDGKIIYVDHADTETLREKYKDDSYVDVHEIVEIDAIWGQNTLQQALGEGRKVNYVIASHVIEHVPDLITWLHELRAILDAGGEIRLAVPDRRFTFDYLRQESRLSDVLNAYLLAARKPLPQLILDFLLNKTMVDVGKAWNGQIKADCLTLENSVETSMNLARDALENGTYHDVHCWVFTPKSFADLFGKLVQASLIDFACERFYDTEKYQFEFFVVLRASDDKAWITESWHRMRNAATVNELAPAD